jgi:hypothetical protein
MALQSLGKGSSIVDWYAELCMLAVLAVAFV